MKFRWLLFLLVVFSLSAFPAAAQEAALAECVTDFDPSVDYFPEKVEPEFSVGWQVEYHNNYKVVDVLTPFPGATADDAIEYVLVQCGTPAPEGYDDARVIEIPAGDVIALGTSYIPQLNELGLLHYLIGLDSLAFVSTPEVLDMIAAGELIEVGSGAGINVEAVLDAEPSLVLTYVYSSDDVNTHPALVDAGIPVVVASDYIEASPLGQAEWIKFTSLFYNAERQANDVFGAKADEYEALVALTAPLADEDKPSVLWNSYTSYSNAWWVPGSESFAGQFIRDAGGALVLGDDPQVAGNINASPFDFEVVYDAGLDADLWFPGTFGVRTLDDLVAQDERYADLAAVQTQQVYNFDARENANGGNDFFENGVANPQDILADLISIMHPELLPDHELIYYRQLPRAE